MPIININTNLILLTRIPSKHKSTGFTLIEILIAMLILSVGLIGLAGFQATSVRNNVGAYNRSQATQLAYDLADRIRANVAGSATYDGGTATAVPNCKTTVGCTPTQMAQNDLFEWNQAVANVFSVDHSNTIALDGTTFTISIRWDEDLNGTDGNDPNIQMDFEL